MNSILNQNLKEFDKKYNKILENANDLIAIFNNKLEYEFINEKSYLKNLGYAYNDVIGKKPRDFVHPDDYIQAAVCLKNAFTEGEALQELRLKDKKGDYIWFEIKVSRFMDNDNESKILLIARDISEKKESDQNLRESEEKYKALFNNSPSAIILIDDNGKIFDCNENSEKIFGYKREDLIGNDFRENNFIPIQNVESFRKSFRYMLNGKSSEPVETILIRKDGSELWAELYASSVKLKNKNVMQIIAHDITEKKLHEDFIRKQIEELNKINKFKSELLKRISHELKTPVVSIKGYTNLLLENYRDHLDSDTISIVEEIDEGSSRLEDLINDLLETMKLESGLVKISLIKEDLSFLIKYCLGELKGLANVRNQTIELHLHDQLITKFEKEKMYEVISNLLSNAIKYTPPGGKIEIKSEIDNNFYIISIKDNGIGLAEEEKEKIFKQFGKIERYGLGWDLGIEGTGLGLYISKMIVELYGGKIWVESEGRNKGSTFSFSLPIIIN